jgi:hypothetical protein
MKTPKKLKASYTTNLTNTVTTCYSPKYANGTRTTATLTGAFNRYRIYRFWGNFNEDLYNRICEIKMQEI